MKTRKRKRAGFTFYCGRTVYTGDVLTHPYYPGATMTIRSADELNIDGLVEAGNYRGRYRIRTARLFSVPSMDEWLKRYFEAAVFPDGRPIEADCI